MKKLLIGLTGLLLLASASAISVTFIQSPSKLNQPSQKEQSKHKKILQELIDQANDLIESAINENGKGKLKEDVVVAKKVIDNSEASIQEVESAIQALKKAILDFEKNNLTNFDELWNTIHIAQDELNKSANQAGKDKLKEAILEATIVATNIDSTQNEVDDFNEILLDAIQTFWEINKTNFNQLQSSIQKAKDILPNGVEDRKVALQIAINEAKEVLKNTNSSQTQANSATRELDKAIEVFTYKSLIQIIEKDLQKIIDTRKDGVWTEEELEQAIVDANIDIKGGITVKWVGWEEYPHVCKWTFIGHANNDNAFKYNDQITLNNKISTNLTIYRDLDNNDRYTFEKDFSNIKAKEIIILGYWDDGTTISNLKYVKKCLRFYQKKLHH